MVRYFLDLDSRKIFMASYTSLNLFESQIPSETVKPERIINGTKQRKLLEANKDLVTGTN